MANKYFTLTWKRVILIIAAWFVSVSLHNAFFAIFAFEEAFFFLLATIVIPLYFLICLIAYIIDIIKSKK